MFLDECLSLKFAQMCKVFFSLHGASFLKRKQFKTEGLVGITMRVESGTWLESEGRKGDREREELRGAVGIQ